MNTITPEAVGLSPARLAHLQKVMQSFVDQGQTAGLITLIARRGKIAHFECYGKMDMASGKAMQPDTIFRIASMSKPITSVALLLLFQEGRIMLNEPVAKYIPEFANLKVFARSSTGGVELAEMQQAITIKDLLSHTAGLTYDFLAPSPVREMYEAAAFFGPFPLAQLQIPVEEVVYRLAKLPLVNQPGQAWSYGIATDVVGHLVSLLADMPFDTFLQERIFAPLGMADTAFTVPPDKLERFATAYSFREDTLLTAIDAPATSLYTNPEKHVSGGSGLVSTATDYWRFAQMLLNRGEFAGTRLLHPKIVDLMTSNHIPDELLPLWFGSLFPMRGSGFGLGVNVLINQAQAGLLSSAGTFGWAGILSTSFQVDPKEDLVCLIMQQLDMFSPVLINPIFTTLAYTALEE